MSAIFLIIPDDLATKTNILILYSLQPRYRAHTEKNRALRPVGALYLHPLFCCAEMYHVHLLGQIKSKKGLTA